MSGESHPTPNDVVLAVEVSNTTLRYDLIRKARLYGAAGVQEYWVVDTDQRRVVVHREPRAEGYASVTEWREGESIAPLVFQQNIVLVSDLFPQTK